MCARQGTKGNPGLTSSFSFLAMFPQSFAATPVFQSSSI